MTTRTCFSRDELRSYLFGDLPEAASGEVASHVETCESCEATVAELDLESDTLIKSLREPVVQAEPAATAYRLAAKRAISHLRSSMEESAVEDLGEQAANAPRLRDYELLEPLARGGMGTVYRARHLRLNRQVALKVLPGRLLQNPGVVARFEREMQAVGSLRHSAIVQATDGGEAEGVHFLVMELIDGVDGSTLVQHLGPLPVADACEIARQAAVGMAYVHQQGIVHRDLKPSNLMVTAAGEVKVLDLGLARIVGEQLAEDELTTVGQLMGTLDFMAPEQVENSHEVDERADVYSLGATLYKLLTGRAPHTTEPGEPLLSKLRRIAAEPPMPLRDRQPDVPVELCELVDRMLSHNPVDRPASMQAVADSLRAFSETNDLARRVNEAVELRKKSKPSERSSVARISASPSVAEAKSGMSHDSRPTGGRRVIAWTAVALLMLAAVMGVVITLQTTAGQLVIETSTPDVEVHVMKAGQPYRQLTLKQSASSLRLGAGEYEIEIISGADGLEIENGSYTLKRGETWLAKIVHRETITEQKRASSGMDMYGDMASMYGSGATPADLNKPTYEGKTLAQWLALLRRERSAKQLFEACRALDKLATGDETDEAVAALLVALRVHSSNDTYQTESGAAIRVWDTVRSVLESREQNAVVTALTNELARHDEANAAFILSYLSRNDATLRPLANEQLLTHVERLATDGDTDVRIQALSALQKLGSEEAATRRLVAALPDRAVEIQLFAAGTLIQMQSNTPLVVSTLRQIVGSGELRQRAEAAWLLGDLGAAAKTALPELMAIVQKVDDAISREAAYHPPKMNLAAGGFGGMISMTSVKDAAIRALAEIGDASVEPILTTEWKRRVSDASSSNESNVAWKSNRGRLMANTYNADWVADAIEQLIGMRPNSEKLGQASVTTWTAKGLSLNSAYSIVFGNRQDRSLPYALDAAKQLMPRARDTEIEQARNCMHSERVPPKRPDELDLEIKLIELLAAADDHPQTLLTAIIFRWRHYAGQNREVWSAEERTACVDAYRDCAVRIIHATKDSETTLIPHLLQLADRDFWPAGAVLMEVLDELDPQQQIESVVHVFRLIARDGKQDLADSMDTVTVWLDDPSHRAGIQKQLENTGGVATDDLVLGMLRSGLADEAAKRILKTRFGYSSWKSQSVMLERLRDSLDDHPDVPQVMIDLIANPPRDAPKSVTLDYGKQISVLARHLMWLGPSISARHRAEFRPMLQRILESGESEDSEAAKQVLDAWK